MTSTTMGGGERRRGSGHGFMENDFAIHRSLEINFAIHGSLKLLTVFAIHNSQEINLAIDS